MGIHNAHEHPHFTLRASFAGDLAQAIRSQPNLLLRLEWPQQPLLSGARLKQEAFPRLDARDAILVTKDDDLGAIRNWLAVDAARSNALPPAAFGGENHLADAPLTDRHADHAETSFQPGAVDVEQALRAGAEETHEKVAERDTARHANQERQENRGDRADISQVVQHITKQPKHEEEDQQAVEVQAIIEDRRD